MREPIILRWCDVCAHESDARTEATETYTVSIVADERNDGARRLVETCEQHGKQLRDVMELVSAVSIPVGATTPFHRPAARENSYDRARRLGSPSVAPQQCPECDETKSGTQALAAHIYSQHLGRAGGVPVRSYPFACPECGESQSTANKYGAHRRLVHDMNALKDALAELEALKRKPKK